MNDPIITFENVSYRYGDKTALSDVSLHIERGQVFGIVGPNGGGKTTFLKLVADLIKPDSGKITFNLKGSRNGKRIGYMPQHASVNWNFPIKVSDVIVMGLYGDIGLIKKVTRKHKEAALDAAHRMGIESLISRHIAELSGGQQQRVFIARAIVSNPELLLLDEPAANMDSNSQDLLYNAIGIIRDELKLTILLVTHDMAVVPKICNQVACVNINVNVHDKPDHLTCPIADDYLGSEKEIFLHGKYPHRMVLRQDGEPDHSGHHH